MSSLRYRRGVGGQGGAGIFGVETPAGAEAGTAGGSFRFARDPAVDQASREAFASVGLAGNPDPPAPLGAQTSPLTSGGLTRFTRAGRPGRFRLIPFRPQERDGNHENRGTLAPGTVRRNVRYAINGTPVPGFFSWAANALAFLDVLDPARPPQDEYVVSSLFQGLPDPLPTVVSGTEKKAPGLEPFRQVPTIQAQPSTGYPVVAPQIPSYGSRVPLRRPRGLVSVDSGA